LIKEASFVFEFIFEIAAGLTSWLIVIAILRPHLTFESELRRFDSGASEGRGTTSICGTGSHVAEGDCDLT
jgi:hypothetical protein